MFGPGVSTMANAVTTIPATAVHETIMRSILAATGIAVHSQLSVTGLGSP
jgi:hypothetical protein